MSGKHQSLGTGADAMEAGSWYDNAYYQILLVKPKPNATPEDAIHTTIVVKQRKDPKSPHEEVTSSEQEYFTGYKLDEKTKQRFNSYPKPRDFDKTEGTIASYLPSSGVVFPQGFIKTLAREKQEPIASVEVMSNYSIEVNNFYEPIRTLLHTRKTSQLIAKTWDAYLEAKTRKVSNTTLWDLFINGDWHLFKSSDTGTDYHDYNYTHILDGLIAREIFLAEQNSSSDHLEPDNLDIYNPLKSQYQKDRTRFLILPNSKAWSGIGLSLLLAGQAYYPVDKDGKYTTNIEDKDTKFHQISEPILSTGEIVTKYGLEVSWDKFKGDIREVGVNPGNNSIAYQAIIPYPPIPSKDNLEPQDIKRWAYAKDDPTLEEIQNGVKDRERRQFPFYHKDNGSYLVDVQYFSPPFPYIPLSCT